MTIRSFTRSYGNDTTTRYAKMGGSMVTVDAVSGQPSENTIDQPRDSSYVSAQPPAGTVAHRQPVQIDAESGLALGDEIEQSAAGAARRYLSVRETAARAGNTPRQQEYFDHLFGLNLPG